MKLLSVDGFGILGTSEAEVAEVVVFVVLFVAVAAGGGEEVTGAATAGAAVAAVAVVVVVVVDAVAFGFVAMNSVSTTASVFVDGVGFFLAGI
jgi:hypothetical protein